MEHEPYYKSSNFIILFCKFAHQATINRGTKIRIIEYNTNPNQLSIANRFHNPQEHINHPPQARINFPPQNNQQIILRDKSNNQLNNKFRYQSIH